MRGCALHRPPPLRIAPSSTSLPPVPHAPFVRAPRMRLEEVASYLSDDWRGWAIAAEADKEEIAAAMQAPAASHRHHKRFISRLALATARHDSLALPPAARGGGGSSTRGCTGASRPRRKGGARGGGGCGAKAGRGSGGSRRSRGRGGRLPAQPCTTPHELAASPYAGPSKYLALRSADFAVSSPPQIWPPSERLRARPRRRLPPEPLRKRMRPL